MCYNQTWRCNLIINIVLKSNHFKYDTLYKYICIHSMCSFYAELMLLRNNDTQMVENEMDMLYQESLHQTEKRSLLSVLRDPTLLLPIMLVCSLSFGQQMSGVNAVSKNTKCFTYYREEQFEKLIIFFFTFRSFSIRCRSLKRQEYLMRTHSGWTCLLVVYRWWLLPLIRSLWQK